MHFLIPSLLGGGWEVQHALFDRIELGKKRLYLKFCQKVHAQPPSYRTGGMGSKSACSTSRLPLRRDGVKKCMLHLLIHGNPSLTVTGRWSKAGSW